MSRPTIFDRRKHEIERNGTAVPFEFDELEREAADALPEASFQFATSAAGRGTTKAANRSAYDRWRIVPRVFRDVSERDLRVDLFGTEIAAPLVLGPIGNQEAFAPEGECASAKAAARLGIPFSLSIAADRCIERVAREGDGAPQLFQLYWTEDWTVTESLVSRAETAGYDAILVTVDNQADRWIPKRFDGEGVGADVDSFRVLETDPVATKTGDGGDQLVKDDTVTWSDIGFLRDCTDLPIVIKGITHPDDARLAVEHGADGVVVSNHGGRQIDGAISSLTALPDVVEAVGSETAVLLDGGIRSGRDAFVGLALGADAVCIGRPYLYGLAIAGAQGVYEVAHNLLAELDATVGQAGACGIGDIDDTTVRNVSGPQ